MNNEIEIFKNNEFGEVRFLSIGGKEYAVGIDIAKALGYSNPSSAISKRCKHGIKQLINNVTCQNGNSHNKARNTQEMTLIPEGDIFRLIVNSRLASAEKFESWVFDEVLPSIRKHGAYITQELLADKEKLEDAIYQLQLDAKMIKEEKEVIQKENCKLRTERHMPSVVCIKANTDESYLPDLALQLVRLYLKEHDNIITRKAEDGIYIKKKPIEKELKKITFTSKERTLLILCIGNMIENTNEIFIKNEYLADDFYLKSTEFLND